MKSDDRLILSCLSAKCNRGLPERKSIVVKQLYRFFRKTLHVRGQYDKLNSKHESSKQGGMFSDSTVVGLVFCRYRESMLEIQFKI